MQESWGEACRRLLCIVIIKFSFISSTGSVRSVCASRSSASKDTESRVLSPFVSRAMDAASSALALNFPPCPHRCFSAFDPSKCLSCTPQDSRT